MIKISISESDDPPEDRKELKLAQKSSKAWYLLPIFLSIFGGVISYLLLRRKDPVRGRNTLIVGAALFALLVMLIVIADVDQDDTHDRQVLPEAPVVQANQMTPDEIKKQAITVPYDLLVKHGDVYVGDIIHYTGHVVDVRPNNDGKSYALKIEVYDTDDSIGYDRMIWSNYEPKIDMQMELITHLQEHGRGLTAVFADSDNAVNVWGTFIGLREYDIVIDKFPVPESDVLILDLLSSSESADKNVPKTMHLVSYDQIPDYVDHNNVKSALESAIDAWETRNPSLDFQIVDAENADLNIEWAHWMQGKNLGLYTSYNITINGQDVTKHNISIRLGDDDCTSNYRQYSHDALTRTIAHEVGHYLGLRHIDDSNHLMHSDGFGERDDVFTYDNRGYSIPRISPADNQFMITGELLDKAELINRELSDAVQEHRNMRDIETPQSQLDASKERINSLTQQLAELETQIECVGESSGLPNMISALS